MSSSLVMWRRGLRRQRYTPFSGTWPTFGLSARSNLDMKKWKTIYIVLRPGALSIYKNEKETKLRHQVHLSDLTAVAFLKDPKHKRHNLFGLFSPSKNFHFEAPSARDAQDWVDLIRKDARIEEEEDEMFLASPTLHHHSPGVFPTIGSGSMSGDPLGDHDRALCSSPEPLGLPTPTFAISGAGRRKSSNQEYSGLSGNELTSYSDFSDSDAQRVHGASIESLALQPSAEPGSLPRTEQSQRPDAVDRSLSQQSMAHMANAEQDLDRVIWQGWLWFLRSRSGVRQWKDMWGVLRARNFILYKDESEYTAQWIAQLSAVVNVVDIDPLSRSKMNCLQIITEEKSYKFCTHDEEALVQFIGAFKSLLARRRGLEARAAGAMPS